MREWVDWVDSDFIRHAQSSKNYAGAVHELGGPDRGCGEQIPSGAPFPKGAAKIDAVTTCQMLLLLLKLTKSLCRSLLRQKGALRYDFCSLRYPIDDSTAAADILVRLGSPTADFDCFPTLDRRSSPHPICPKLS